MRTRIISLLVVASIFVFGCAPQEELPRLIPMKDFLGRRGCTYYRCD
jgi:hypothetical protein